MYGGAAHIVNTCEHVVLLVINGYVARPVLWLAFKLQVSYDSFENIFCFVLLNQDTNKTTQQMACALQCIIICNTGVYFRCINTMYSYFLNRKHYIDLFFTTLL